MLRELALGAWRAGVEAVDPARSVARCLAGRRDLRPDSPSTLVVAVGKAAASMMRGAAPVARGLVLCPPGSDVGGLGPAVEVLYGGHPQPTPQGIEASRRIAGEVAALGRRQTLLFLLSGGASSLLEVPCEGLAADDLIAAHRALVAGGAPIDDINRVRRCLSQVKGGALLELAAPARVCTLAVSDVVGDDPATIGSGPTVPAPRDGRAALEIVARCSLEMPAAVLERLRALAAEHDRRDGEDDGRWSGAPATIDYTVVAAVGDAVAAAAAYLQRRGCEVMRHPTPLVGETREVAEQVAAVASALAASAGGRGSAAAGGEPAALPPRAWIGGGETTVRVPAHGAGTGGRNLDLAARLALRLQGREGFACAVAGTDGRDGSGRGAGALIDGGTAGRAERAGRPLAEALAAFDTQPAIEAAGDLLVTGPTGTNVGDLLVAVFAAASRAS